MKDKEVWIADKRVRRAKSLLKTKTETTTVIRYLNRCSKEGAKEGFRICVTPIGNHFRSYHGAYVVIPSGIAMKELKSLLKIAKQEATTQLADM